MRNFIKHFSEKWISYLIVLALIFIFWLVTVDSLVAVKPENRIGIFIGAYGISPTLEGQIEKPDGIEEIEIYDVNIDEDYYFVIFDAYASNGDFDFSIVNEKQFRESDIQYYQILDEDVITELFGATEYYRVNGDVYGIKIYDASTGKGILNDVISYGDENFSEDYYLFFRKGSLHSGAVGLSADTASADDKAIRVIQSLIDAYMAEEK